MYLVKAFLCRPVLDWESNTKSSAYKKWFMYVSDKGDRIALVSKYVFNIVNVQIE